MTSPRWPIDAYTLDAILVDARAIGTPASHNPAYGCVQWNSALAAISDSALWPAFDHLRVRLISPSGAAITRAGRELSRAQSNADLTCAVLDAISDCGRDFLALTARARVLRRLAAIGIHCDLSSRRHSRYLSPRRWVLSAQVDFEDIDRRLAALPRRIDAACLGQTLPLLMGAPLDIAAGAISQATALRLPPLIGSLRFAPTHLILGQLIGRHGRLPTVGGAHTECVLDTRCQSSAGSEQWVLRCLRQAPTQQVHVYLIRKSACSTRAANEQVLAAYNLTYAHPIRPTESWTQPKAAHPPHQLPPVAARPAITSSVTTAQRVAQWMQSLNRRPQPAPVAETQGTSHGFDTAIDGSRQHIAQ